MEFKMEYSRSSRNVLFSVFSDIVTSMRIKKIDSSLGPLCVEFAHSLHICGGFIQVLGFLPSTKDVHMKPVVPVWVCGCECALQWKGVLSRVGACLCLELPGVALSSLDPELKMIFWKIILFLLIFLKCMHSSHLFQRLIMKVFWVLI